MRQILAILLAAAIPAMAEPGAGRTCRIVFPERPNDAPKSAHLFDGKKSHPVTLPSMNFSEVIALPSGELTLLMTPEETKDPASLPADAPKLTIPEAVKDFYILVSPEPGNPTLPVKLKMVPAGPNDLKAGQTLWTNLTDHRIQAKLGEMSLLLEPMGQTVSKAPAPGSGYYKAEFSYQPHGEGEFRKITEQSWWHDANSRHVGFVSIGQGTLPNVYFYRDFREPGE